MRPYKNRVLIVCLVLLIAFTAVFFRLDSLMIDGQEASTARASSRSTKTLSVTGMRGTVYDVNMTPLAYDRRSYNVTFYRDPSRSSEEDRKGYTRYSQDHPAGGIQRQIHHHRVLAEKG